MSAKTNAKKKEQDKPQSSGLGLDGLGDLAGLLNEQPAANAAAHSRRRTKGCSLRSTSGTSRLRVTSRIAD